MRWLPVVFVVIPFTELMILLEVASQWGFWPTLGLILLTAFIGVNLFKSQGLQTWRKLQEKLSQGQSPESELLDGILILLAGTLMITPGLMTDVVGVLLLIPVSRSLLRKKLISHFSVAHHTHSAGNQSAQSGRIFDGDYRKDD